MTPLEGPKPRGGWGSDPSRVFPRGSIAPIEVLRDAFEEDNAGSGPPALDLRIARSALRAPRLWGIRGRLAAVAHERGGKALLALVVRGALPS